MRRYIYLHVCNPTLCHKYLANTMCRPVKAYWTLSFTDQHCINETANLLAAGILNTISDFIVFFLPIPTVLALQLPFRQRMMLCTIFGAGFVVCIAGCFRIYYSYQTTSTFDRTWVSYGLWISGVLELYIGIVSLIHSQRQAKCKCSNLIQFFTDVHSSPSMQAILLSLPTFHYRHDFWVQRKQFRQLRLLYLCQ